MIYPQLEEINPKRAESYYKNRYPEFVQYLHNTYPDVIAFNEKLYWFYHNITEQPKCKICGDKVSFRGFNFGYSKYCSSTCVSKDPERIRKIKQTNLKKYGVEYYNNIQKIKQTNLKKYGVENPFQSEQIKEKIKQGYLEKYNVEYPSQSQEIQETRRKNSLKKYGVDHHMKIEEVKQKVSKGTRNFHIGHIDGLIGYDEDGNQIRACPHPECKKCSEKFYVVNVQIFCARKEYSLEPCTRILPVSRSHAKGTSLEIFIRDILDEYNVGYITNDRSIGTELDIYIPSKQIAIECNGCFWHSEQHNHNPKKHIDKFKECQNHNIQLLTIWEDWIINKPNIVKSIILNKLGLTQNKIYARQCIIKEVQSKDATKFLNENHIQGATKCSIKLGLYYNDELVSLICFNKRSKLSGSKNMIEGEYELIRFCNKLNTSVVGGASKLLKYFIKKYNPSIITSFSSNDISNGNLYKTLGFESDYNINKSYWYIEPTTMKRYHRTSFTRSSIAEKFGYDINDKTWTERSVMDKMRYYRIYDSGTLRWKLLSF